MITISRICAVLVRLFIIRILRWEISLICGKVGRRLIVRGVPYLRMPRSISIGDDCQIGRRVSFSSEVAGAELNIDDGVDLGNDISIDFSGDCSIGCGTLISHGVKIYTHDHGLVPRSKPKTKRKRIGSNVWIGTDVLVLASCQEIGDGAVIGARSVVSQNVPARTVVVGMPARVVRNIDE